MFWNSYQKTNDIVEDILESKIFGTPKNQILINLDEKKLKFFYETSLKLVFKYYSKFILSLNNFLKKN